MYKKAETEFIKNAGACIVSKNILSGEGKLKWIIREEPIEAPDSGWRFFSDIDDDDYVNEPDNLVVCDYNTVAEIEPGIIPIYVFPVGSDLQLVVEDGRMYFVDNLTEEEVDLGYL